MKLMELECTLKASDGGPQGQEGTAAGGGWSLSSGVR